ncbi:matrix metalloproteinase-25 [Astyanax mexicanus]|uniref:matrix metalloproteinase-25 n=1 Tax=Astyanax mexicanus TaxID=7994 RepID=UPI0020CAEF9F|nr:matrix metalloproteinase-25 [Astyanax mexicanus]XP_049320704.1 matrix metalloproteinase-25 [Astyanax mexicanus]
MMDPRPAVLALTAAVIALAPPVCPAPMPDQYSRGVDWLSRYGYLPPPDPRTGKLQTKEGIEKAIRQMQRFGGLKETGKLDSATLKLMSTPRCSLPDIVGTEDRLRRRRKRYTLSGLRWDKTNLTWSVLNSPSLPPNLKPDLVSTLMFHALQVWSDNTNIQFSGLQPKDAKVADIRISFARFLHDDGYPFDGKGGTLAHAFFPGTVEIAGDTHFDDEETWTYGGQDGAGTDLFTVAVHEFGHALGLSHSSVNPSIMMPYYQGAVGDIRSYKLPQDDVQAIQILYGRKTNAVTSSPGDRTTPRLPELPKTPPKATLQPDPGSKDRCEGGFDAIGNIRGDVFFFKGPYFWRMQRGSLVSLNPAQITNFWIGLPQGTDKIDAVYERKTDSHIIFFIGSQFWVFKDTVALPGYPQPISKWGMRNQQVVEKVDAAFVWAHNGKTYIFSGGLFWRFTESQGGAVPRPDAEYPRNASLWKGAPANPDDIMSWGSAGDTYFFKGNSYWVVKSGGLDQDVIIPKSTAVDWMFCPPPPPTTKSAGSSCDCSCGVSGASRSFPTSRLIFISVLIMSLIRLG